MSDNSESSDYVIVKHPRTLPIESPEKRPEAMYFAKQQPYRTQVRQSKLQADVQLRRHHRQPKDFHLSKLERADSYPKTSKYVKSSRHQVIQPGKFRRDMHRYY